MRRGATPAIVEWLDTLLEGGGNVPHDGRHALVVFPDALGVQMPSKRQAVNVAQRIIKTKQTKHAPAVPLEFSIQLEMYAADARNDKTIRFYFPWMCLVISASLCFSDTIETQHPRATKSAIFGISVDQKSPKRELKPRAAPGRGFKSGGCMGKCSLGVLRGAPTAEGIPILISYGR